MSYHTRTLKYFSSNPNDWNYNILCNEDIDPYTGKNFNYRAVANVYNGMKYNNEICVRELLKYINVSEELNEYINKTCFNGTKTKFYKSFKMLQNLFLCVVNNFNETCNKKEYNYYLKTKSFFIIDEGDEKKPKSNT